jgi:Tfp pilus assembly protein PilF
MNTLDLLARPETASNARGSEEITPMRTCWLWRVVWTLAVLGGITCRTFGADQSPSVTILTFSGSAEVSRREAVWDPAHTNQILLAGDKMRTGKKSRATIRLSDGTTMTIGAEASFEVPASENKKGVTLNPLKGLFYFFHRDKPGEFELRSRSTAAAVRGTEFHLEANEDGTWLLSVLDGDVLLQTAEGELDLKTGRAALAKPGAKPQPVVMRRAEDLIQWVFYYPAVLDVNDLILTPEEQNALKDSFSAYRDGDIATALARCSFENPPRSDMEAIYRAALLLSVGQVEDAENFLATLSLTGENAERVRSLKSALEELIAVVKGLPRANLGAPASSRHDPEQPQPAAKMAALPEERSASARLAESYRLQSESKLPEALAAAREAARLSPNFGLALERIAELEFSFGHIGSSHDALEKSLRLSPRNSRAKALEGFLLAADNHISDAIESFNEAIALDGSQGNAWLGRGLCQIRRGETKAGREDLLVAAALEPQRSVFRSYLGKAFAMSRDSAHAHKELALAQKLDPHDPTAWLYSSLLLLEENRINEAIAALEKSAALNENRSLFRSRLLLDQDRAVRGANLAAIYQDAGMNEVAVREATKAVESDYGNYSAHLFLANSYNALRDPQQINLRYETAWLSEYLVANLLSPVGAGTLSPMVSQEEYSRLFEQNGPGFTSFTEYSSRGDWTQSAVQHGTFGNTSYAVEDTYRTQNGERPNNDMEQLTVSLRLKQQLTARDSVYLQAIYYNAEGGDLAQYYDPANANQSLRFKETQEPLLLVGYHHEWSPGVHTLALAGRLQDSVDVTNADAGTLFFRAFQGQKQFGSFALYDQDYHNDQLIYVSEVQQTFEIGAHTLIFGGRYQTGDFDVQSDISHGATFPAGTPTGIIPITQNVSSDFERYGVYGYEQWRPFKSLLLIGGAGYDWISYPANYQFAPISTAENKRDLLGAKGGLVWTPTRTTTFRAGYSHSLGGVSFDQSFRLEPSQVAGFNQAFRSAIPESIVGTVAAPALETYGVQLEQNFPTRTYFGVSAGVLQSDANRSVGAVQFDPQPNVPTPNPFQPTTTSQRLDYNERALTITLNQLVCDDLAFGATYQISRAHLEDNYTDVPTGIGLASPFALSHDQTATLHQIRLYGAFNHPCGFFCGAEGLWFSQQNDGYSPALAGDNFWQCNVYGGYRWWHRRAELRVALLNVTDQNYRLNPLNLTAHIPRDRTLTVSFRFSF